LQLTAQKGLTALSKTQRVHHRRIKGNWKTFNTTSSLTAECSQEKSARKKRDRGKNSERGTVSLTDSLLKQRMKRSATGRSAEPSQKDGPAEGLHKMGKYKIQETLHRIKRTESSRVTSFLGEGNYRGGRNLVKNKKRANKTWSTSGVGQVQTEKEQVQSA